MGHELRNSLTILVCSVSWFRLFSSNVSAKVGEVSALKYCSALLLLLCFGRNLHSVGAACDLIMRLSVIVIQLCACLFVVVVLCLSCCSARLLLALLSLINLVYVLLAIWLFVCVISLIVRLSWGV